MPAFLDPNKPIVTCASENCQDCPAGHLVHCHYRWRDLAHFLLNAIPPFMVGGVAIARIDWWWLVLWLLVIPGYFGLLEIRVMCSHCPHYAEEGSTLRCWANYGSPKLWTYRPGPMSHMERFWFYAGMVAVLGYPLVFILLGQQWLLLVLYMATTVSAGATLKFVFCTHCMNFACPLNATGVEARRAFFERNPGVARTWRQHE